MTPGRGDEVVELPTGRAALHARAVPVEEGTVDRLLEVGDHPLVLWRPPEGAAVAGAGAVASVRTEGANRFERVREWAAGVDRRLTYDGPRAARPRVLGGFAFGDAPSQDHRWEAFPPAWFVLPAVQLVSTDDGAWLTVTAETAEPDARPFVERLADEGPAREDGSTLPALTEQEAIPTREGWFDQVQEIQGEIDAGRLRKVVLGHTVRAALDDVPRAAVAARRLRELHPACYRFAIAPEPDQLFLGASPERLVEGAGRTLRTDALAGSRRRGEGPASDRELAAALRESPKDGFEHEVVVDAIHDRLRACCQDVTTGERSIRRLSTVQHLHTELRATRSPECHLLDVAEALHPTPAVGGLPTDAALATLDRLEAFDRGWYAGPVGWFDLEGDGQFAIGIRSAAVADTEAALFAGAGIVAESDPDAEWNELQLKYQPIRSTFGDR